MPDAITKQSVTFQGKVDGGTDISVSVNILPATEDCIRVVLHERVALLSLGPLALAWLAIVVTIAITLATATFHDYAGVSASVIQALFLLTLLVSGAMCLWYSIRFVCNAGKTSVDSIVNEIRSRS